MDWSLKPMLQLHDAAPCPWSQFEPAVEKFCEKRLCAWVVEPANAWSNLAYVAVGLYLLWLVRHRLRSAMAAPAYTAILVGIGSFAFHATGTLWGQILDVSAMYLISAMFIVFNAKRYWSWTSGLVGTSYAAIAGASIVALVNLRWIAVPLFVAHLIVAAALELALFLRDRQAVDYRHLRRLIWAFAASYVAWLLDVHGIVCDPDNHVFTGHAFWHCANSLCLYFFYKHHQQFDAIGSARDMAV